MPATELILVRHGETEWNRARRIQGWIDVPLSSLGRAQARATARRLAAERIDALWSSDLARARQTAAPIAEALGLEPAIDERLRERACGDFEGVEHEVLARDFAGDYARWRAREPHVPPPGGGETLAAFHGRVERALDEIADRHRGRRVVVVTHGGVLDCAWRIGTGARLDAPRTVELLNASLNRLGRDRGGWSVLGWSDVAHLDAALDDADPA